MEKFLLLTRRYLGATFQVMKKGTWEEESVKVHLELLQEVPCNVEDMRLPNGLRFHVIDIYVDELERVGALDSEEDSEVPIERLLEPLKRLAEKSPMKAVRNKAKEALKDERFLGKD